MFRSLQLLITQLNTFLLDQYKSINIQYKQKLKYQNRRYKKMFSTEYRMVDILFSMLHALQVIYRGTR